MSIPRHLSDDSLTVLRPGADTPAPCAKPEAAKGDDDLMSTECAVSSERRPLVTEVVEDLRDDVPEPPLARQDLAAVLARLTKHYPHLTYLPAE